MCKDDKLASFANGYRQWLIEWMDPEGDYRILLDRLFEYEYTWIHPYDINRAEDGCYLRNRYAEYSGDICDESYIDWPCSMLEFLVALAIRIDDSVMYSIKLGDRTVTWFWEMIRNLGLDEFYDIRWKEDPEEISKIVDQVVDKFLNRRYNRQGHGGIFPMENPKEDQRNLEIWDQMNEYFTYHP